MIDWDKRVLAPTMGVFGEPVTYTPAGGSPFSVNGVYDEAYKTDIQFEDGLVGATATKPLLGVRLSEFALPPAQNDRLYIPRVDLHFIVTDVQADSHGWAKLILNRTAP